MNKNKPVYEKRLGRIRGTVWKNENDNGAFFNVGFSRLYKDDSGQWRDAATFSRDDLLLVAKIADQLHGWIFESSKGENSEGNPTEAGD